MMTRQGLYRVMLIDIERALALLCASGTSSKDIQAALDECPAPREMVHGPFTERRLRGSLSRLARDIRDAIDGNGHLGIVDGETGELVKF